MSGLAKTCFSIVWQTSNFEDIKIMSHEITRENGGPDVYALFFDSRII